MFLKRNMHQNRGQFYQQNQQKIEEDFGSDTWEVKLDCVEECSKAPEKVNVFFSQLAKCKIDALMKAYKGDEWLAYLLGNDTTVEDIFIPEQAITSITVDDVNCPEYNNLKVIGVIHSHNHMSPSFSGTDNDWINQNHNISICVSDNDINGQVRWKTPCGALKITKARIKSKIDIDFSDEKFIEAVKDKIKKKTFVNSYYESDGSGVYTFLKKDEEDSSVTTTEDNTFLTKEDKEFFNNKVAELNFDDNEKVVTKLDDEEKSLIDELKEIDKKEVEEDKM